MVYFLQSSIILMLLYGVYWFFLRKNTFYGLNRWVLISIPICAVIFPFVELPTIVLAPEREVLVSSFKELNYRAIEALIIDGDLVQNQGPTVENVSVFPWASIVTLIYLLGFTIFLAKVFTGLFSLHRLIKAGQIERSPNFSLVRIEEKMTPLAFFRWILVNPAQHTPQQFDHILAHEQVHVSQWHSLDILLGELFTSVFWFHPLAWMWKRSLKLNLEFLADQTVLKEGHNRKAYQYDLLKLSIPGSKITTANHFNYSHLKIRIAMMNSKQSSRLSIWKYSLFLPIMAMLLLAFKPSIAQSGTEHLFSDHLVQTLKIKDNQNIYVNIQPEFNPEDQATVTTMLLDVGVDIRASEFEYDNDGYLTKVIFRVKIGNEVKTVESYNNGRPINKSINFYLLRHKNNRMGVSAGYPASFTKGDRKTFDHFTGIMIGTFSAD